LCFAASETGGSRLSFRCAEADRSQHERAR
jgi:hypothetical protein